MDEATETICEATEAMHRIHTLSALAVAGTPRVQAESLAQILALSAASLQDLKALCKEMIEFEKKKFAISVTKA